VDWGTLAGVALGGAISLGSAYLLEWRRDRTATTKAADAAKVELQTAARLVRSELIYALAEIEGSWHANRYPLPAEIPLRQWDQHTATLARLLPAPDWGQVLVGVGRVKEMNRAVGSEWYLREPSEQELHDLEDHHKEITDASEVLWLASGDRERLRGSAS
jgi:hypothetical protein